MRTVQLGEIADIIRGVSFESSEQREPSSDTGVVCLKTSNIQNQIVWEDFVRIDPEHVHRDEQWLASDDVVISMANSLKLVGKVAYATEVPVQATVGAFLAIIRSKNKNEVLPEFLYFALSSPSVRQQMRRDASQSVNIANLSLSTLRPLEIPVPKLEEQKDIVSKVKGVRARADRARTHLERIPELADKFKKSLLADAFSGEMTRGWRERNPDVEPASELLDRIRPERRRRWVENYAADLADRARKRADKKGEPFDEEDWQACYEKKIPQGEDRYEEPEPVDVEAEDLPEIPETWEWISLSEMSWNSSYGTSEKCEPHWSGTPVLRSPNIQDGEVITEDLKFTQPC